MSEEQEKPQETGTTIDPDSNAPTSQAPEEPLPFEPDRDLITYIERSQKPKRAKSS